MKNSDRIRLLIAVLIGCVAIIALVWTRLGSGKNRTIGEADSPVTESVIEEADTPVAKSVTEDAASLVMTADVLEETQYEAGTGASAQAASSAAGTGSTALLAGASSSAASTAKTTAKPKHDISGNSLYKSEAAVTYAKTRVKEPKDPEGTLTELKSFWETIGLDALRDLWELDRYQQLTVWLSEHPEIPYYYCGDKGASGVPDGKGVAIYSGNRFYYGDWKNGRREGKGEWYQFYPARMQNVVLLHEYTGEWVDDLPDGEGVELYEYDLDRMDEDSIYPSNLIGHFRAGLCDGEMTVTTLERDGSIRLWYGTCRNGVWQPIDGHPDADGKISALYWGENKKERISIWPEYNVNQGVDHVR